MTPAELTEWTNRLKTQVARVVVGQDDVVEALIIALLVRGHILLEGPPGTAKTLLAQSFAGSLNLDFNRIQFTPDLMPGDVTGTNIFDFRTNAFALTKGPVFTDFLLADEINRTPPKTQAALLQAMQEQQVTLDGTTHDLSDNFIVVATQNPIEQEGTYPLPEAQLDRFLFKVIVGFPTRDQERAIVRLHGHRATMPDLKSMGITAIADRETLAIAREAISNLTLSDEVLDYIVDLVRSTRNASAFSHGASPRATNMLAMAARARAALNGRDYVLPDDVKALFIMTLRHRVGLTAASEVEGRTVDSVLREALAAVAAPR